VLRGFWHNTLRQPDPGDLAAKLEGSLNVGFIDYGRGNGLVVGPGGDAEWTPVPIDDSVAWVGGYRGLFGLDTYDRFAGERAPAGPKYNRNGTVRQTWYDPLGWAGLDKVAPPSRAPEVLEERIASLAAQAAALDDEIAGTGAELQMQALEVRALADEPSLSGLRARGTAALVEAEAAQASRRRTKVELGETARAAREELARIRAGEWGDPRSHLQHEHHPIPAEETRYGILIEVRSAISVSLLLIATIGLIYLGILSVWFAIVVVIGAYAFVEAAFQRRLTTLLLRLTLILAVIGAIVLGVTYAVQTVVVLLIALAGVILLDNVRELRGR
jgi:uncharacterized membrane protein